MEIQVREESGVTVVEPVGAIDGKTAPEFQEKVLAIVQPDERMLLHLGKVNFMSSAGLRVMLLVYREATAKKARVVLSGMNADVGGSMSATGFLQFFTTRATLEEGLAALR